MTLNLIPEGKSYRVELDDSTGATAPASIKTKQAHPVGRRRFILLFLLGTVAIAAVGTAAGYIQSVESPDCPQPNQWSRPN
jgi:hypothetical protein